MAINARAVPVTMAATVEQMETQHKLWGARIGEMEAAGESRRVQAKINRQKLIEDLKSQHRLARVKLDELKAAGSEKWQDFRAGVETAGKTLEATLHRADRLSGKTISLVWYAALILSCCGWPRWSPPTPWAGLSTCSCSRRLASSRCG